VENQRELVLRVKNQSTGTTKLEKINRESVKLEGIKTASAVLNNHNRRKSSNAQS